MLIALLSAMLSTGCSPSPKEVDIYTLLIELCETNGEAYGKEIIYFDRTRNSENGDFHTLSEEKLGYLYTGRFEPPGCMSRISGYALRMPLDTSGYEIHIIECLNPSDTSEISSLLQKRIDKLQGSEILSIAPETYEMYFRGAVLYSKGRYVFLLATPDNASVIKRIEKVL